MKSKILKMLVSLATVVLCFGCAANKQMYHWDKYSDTLYNAKKTPGVESLAEHKEVLDKIVEESQKRNLRVPPGVYAELGYLYALQNDTKKAVSLFEMEKKTYPESTILMDRMIQQSEKRATVESPSEETVVEKEIEKEKNIGGGSND